MGQIFFAGKKSQEGTALLRDVIADCAAQHGISDFERIEDRAHRHRALDRELDIATNLRQGSKMGREYDSDHHSQDRMNRSRQSLHFDRQNRRKITDDGSPTVSGIG